MVCTLYVLYKIGYHILLVNRNFFTDSIFDSKNNAAGCTTLGIKNVIAIDREEQSINLKIIQCGTK